MSHLNTSNSQQLVYDNTLLRLTVLGGLRMDGLDRMRVTLKLELPDSPRPPLRHNLDLYNDTQLEKLIRKTAERLEVGTSLVSASLSELTGQLEQYRLEQLSKEQQQQHQRPQLTPQEQEQALAFLGADNLLQRTNDMIGLSGVVGEETNRLLMYLIFTSRKRDQPLHVMSLGSSGTGKTHLQERVGRLMPEEDRIEITTLSENAFYYFGQRELRHRLILIEDLDGAEGVLYPMRELMSKKRISKTIAQKSSKGQTKTIQLVVEGPVSVSGCTTKESIYEDNANRSFLLYLDESPEQDERIMQYQRAMSAGKVDTVAEQQAATLLSNCQRMLKPVGVRNPYAEWLKIPQEVFKPRRSNAHYLAFIEAVTFYHQYQRAECVCPDTGQVYISTTLDDIASANVLIKDILLRKSDELSGACRNYLERLKKWVQTENKPAFTNAQARMALRENHSNQKRYMLQLQQTGMIQRLRGDKKHGYYYQITSMEEYEKLRAGITGMLDHILNQAHTAVHGSPVVHPVTEPLKPAPHQGKPRKFRSSVTKPEQG